MLKGETLAASVLVFPAPEGLSKKKKKKVGSFAKAARVVDSCQNARTFPQPHTREQTLAPAPPQQPLHDVHRKFSVSSSLYPQPIRVPDWKHLESRKSLSDWPLPWDLPITP